MNKSADPPFDSYEELARSLLGDLAGICLLDQNLECRGRSGSINLSAVQAWLRACGWADPSRKRTATAAHDQQLQVVALAIPSTQGKLLGALCVQLSRRDLSRDTTDEIAKRLRPLVAILHRELNADSTRRSKQRTLTERTEELEWLFEVTQRVSGASGESSVIADLLAAATERLDSALGTLIISEKRMALEHVRCQDNAVELRSVLAATRQHLMSWAQRKREPLVVNHTGSKSGALSACKMLCVPLLLQNGRTIGILIFFRPRDAANFSQRQVFLARHLGRQTASLVAAQFDLMTGLHTRSGLEQAYATVESAPETRRSVAYIDLDHLHAANELHGFEIGNELIARIADLLTSSIVPVGTIAARVSGDRFALVLLDADARRAAEICDNVRAAVSRIVLGPADAPIDISVSCGTADLVEIPDGLARALAAAEIACRLAKDRGRNRVEIYANEDHSLIRRRDEVAAVAQLRSALKENRLVLYAQRIAPLLDTHAPGGYEILMRVRNRDGSLAQPGPLIDAAHRYQLLPSVDRWVVENALRILAGYRAMLSSREISFSINFTGQSLGDEACVDLVVNALRDANLPRGCITIELTEQAAVRNLARASDVVQRLAFAGCKFALDDFGTGNNSLSYLKSLQLSHIKIDGSFVRDILTNSRSQSTVRGMVELAREFRIGTVAEYVENAGIAEYLRRLGVEYAQGYAFGKPEPLDALLRKLSNDESQRLHKLFLEL